MMDLMYWYFVIITALAIIVFFTVAFGEGRISNREKLNDELETTKQDVYDMFDIELSKELRYPFAILQYIGILYIVIMVCYILAGPYLLAIRLRVWFLEMTSGIVKTVNKILYKDKKE